MDKAKILVVEDEPLLRLMARDVLDECGFTVIDAATVDEGLRFLEDNSGDVDVLFTDVSTHSSLDGTELAAVVAQSWPWIKIVVTSGSKLPRSLPDDAIFLEKPWMPTRLLSIVRTASLH